MLATTDSATTRGSRLSAARRRIGLVFMAAGVAGWLGWIAWRAATLSFNLIPIAALLIETAGAAIGVVVAFALATVDQPRATFDDDRRDPWRYAFAVADRVGRTRAVDLHREVRSAATAARRARHRTRADVAMGCVLVDGPRRLLMVVVAVVGLLFGVSPMPVPAVPALISLAIGVGGLSLATVVLSQGRIALGDRLRWTYASIGELLIRDDIEGVAPRRWVGTVGTIVVVNLAVALRGMIRLQARRRSINWRRACVKRCGRYAASCRTSGRRRSTSSAWRARSTRSPISWRRVRLPSESANAAWIARCPPTSSSPPIASPARR